MSNVKNNKEIKLNQLTPEEQLKYEIAEELGLFPKVLSGGWKSLSAKESGKIGGILASRKKKLKAEQMNNLS